MGQTQLCDYEISFSDISKMNENHIDIDEHSGRLASSRTENLADIHGVVMVNRRIIICELSEYVQISYVSVQHIVTDDILMGRVSATLSPIIF